MANPNLLLVEGDEDLRVVPHLVEANGHVWGERPGPFLVDIKALDGIESLLAEGEIGVRLKQSGLRRCGIMVDADSDPAGRWREVLARLPPMRVAMPEQPCEGGGFGETASGVKVGIWLMPDNLGQGMLETFLQRLRRSEQAELLTYARQVCEAASDKGAPFKPVHIDKAAAHTLLAWQDPPGRQLHQAVMEYQLDPRGPGAAAFIAWFRQLYELTLPNTPGAASSAA